MGIKPPKQWRARGIVRTPARKDSSEFSQGMDEGSSRSLSLAGSGIEASDQAPAPSKDRKGVGFGHSLSNLIS